MRRKRYSGISELKLFLSDSFGHEILHHQLLQLRGIESVPTIICSNLEDKQTVSKCEGEELVKRLHVDLFESSTESNINIDVVICCVCKLEEGAKR